MKYLPVILFLAILLLSRCEKEEVILIPPVASFTLSPGNGLTTTVFQFNASESKMTNAGEKLLFLRWDWDNDNNWDTGFSRSRTFTHRYYKPGVYSPRLEVRNEAGMSDTVQLTVNVAQGNSAPQPVLSISPASGNLRTEFFFDASRTRDDEDSLNTLQFRWDVNGDGIYDTPYSESTTYQYTYSNAGLFFVSVDVIDPQGVSATTKKSLTVSLSNPELVPQFTWTPEKPTTADTVIFDATTSYDPNEPDNTFQYRWNFNKDDQFDTEYLDDPIVSYQFAEEGENQVILEIRDQYGLINQKKTTIWIGHANKKPEAFFFVGHEYGNLTTNFYFDADGISDPEDYIDQLKVRWDFENDGTWDTQFAKERTANHKYSAPGTYRIKMEVIDSGGLTDSTSLSVEVSSGTNETGMIIDKAKNIFYGTVKIGSQWWMAENLNENTGSTGQSCYSNRSDNCATYGRLYTWTTAMGGATTERTRGLCPSGWHIPTQAEWQQLVDHVGPTTALSRLEVGGDTDFRLLMAGQRNTNNRYEHLGTLANFWTSSKAAGENAWVYSFQSGQQEVYRIVLSSTYQFSMRCIKD